MIGFVLVGTNDLNRAICFYNAISAPRSEPSVSLSFGHRADGHWCPEDSSWRVSLSFYEGRDCYTKVCLLICYPFCYLRGILRLNGTNGEMNDARRPVSRP